MYVSSCPLRVSLFGGSTDNPYFVEKYGYGAVISFTCDLKTYITIHEDKFGFNKSSIATFKITSSDAFFFIVFK